MRAVRARRPAITQRAAPNERALSWRRHHRWQRNMMVRVHKRRRADPSGPIAKPIECWLALQRLPGQQWLGGAPEGAGLCKLGHPAGGANFRSRGLLVAAFRSWQRPNKHARVSSRALQTLLASEAASDKTEPVDCMQVTVFVSKLRLKERFQTVQSRVRQPPAVAARVGGRHLRRVYARWDRA